MSPASLALSVSGVDPESGTSKNYTGRGLRRVPSQPAYPVSSCALQLAASRLSGFSASPALSPAHYDCSTRRFEHSLEAFRVLRSTRQWLSLAGDGLEPSTMSL